MDLTDWHCGNMQDNATVRMQVAKMNSILKAKIE